MKIIGFDGTMERLVRNLIDLLSNTKTVLNFINCYRNYINKLKICENC